MLTNVLLQTSLMYWVHISGRVSFTLVFHLFQIRIYIIMTLDATLQIVSISSNITLKEMYDDAN